MSMISSILDYNKAFVEQKIYEPFRTTKYPDKKLGIVTCMDTRLLELLPKAMGLANGDAKVIKNAGGCFPPFRQRDAKHSRRHLCIEGTRGVRCWPSWLRHGRTSIISHSGRGKPKWHPRRENRNT